MAVEITLLNSNSLSNISTNFQRVKNALQEVVGRNGDLPNHMNIDLDMNGNDVLNARTISAESLMIDGLFFEGSSKILIDNGPPAPTLGKLSDIYIDALNGNVYGPKTDGGWGDVALNIIGPSGRKGVNYRGVWSPATTYVEDDVVRDATGRLWIAEATSTSVSPVEGPSWSLFLPSSIGDLPNFTGATASVNGANGLVPAPLVADRERFLKGNGTWAETPASDIRSVFVDDYGAVGNGVANDTAAFQAAQVALGAAGGIIQTGRGKRYRINGLTLNTSVQIEGPYLTALRPGGNFSQSYADMGALLLESPIVAAANTAFKGLYIFPYGKTFPYTGEASFAGTGTAITYVNASANEVQDVTVENCSIIGFQRGLLFEGLDRARVISTNFDCINPIEIADCWDICYIDKVHCWPFATIDASSSPTQTRHKRTGVGIHLRDTADWAKITDSFTYGYQNGMILDTVNSVTVNGFGADNTPGADLWPTNGILLRGPTGDIRLDNIQTAAQGNAGVYIESSSGSNISINNLNVWGGGTHCMVIVGPATVNIHGSTFTGGTFGVTVSDGYANVRIDGCSFRNQTEANINATLITERIHIGDMNFFEGTTTSITAVGVPGNTRPWTLTMSDPLVIPKYGEVFVLSGSTSFGSARGVLPGRTVRLITTAAFNIYHSTGALGIATPSGATMAVAADRVVTLVSDGNRWFVAD